jgi:hypothetical protein
MPTTETQPKPRSDRVVFRTHWLRALLIAEIPIIAVLFSLISDRDPTIPLTLGVLVGLVVYVFVRLGKIVVTADHLLVGRHPIPWHAIRRVRERHNKLIQYKGRARGPYHHVLVISVDGSTNEISLPEVGRSDLFRIELARHISDDAFTLSNFDGPISRPPNTPPTGTNPPRDIARGHAEGSPVDSPHSAATAAAS